MAIFTNQATLTYTGGSANSNIAVGEIIEVLSADKTAVSGTYAPGELVTYVITIRNTGTGAFTGLTVTDDLGGGTNAPLTYENGTVLYFVNGVLQAAPTVTAGPPLVFTGITVPGNGDAACVARVGLSVAVKRYVVGLAVQRGHINAGGALVRHVAGYEDPILPIRYGNALANESVIQTGILAQRRFGFVIIIVNKEFRDIQPA